MEIFKGRPLLVGGVIFVCAGSLCWFFQTPLTYCILIPAAVIAALAVFVIYRKGKVGRYRFFSVLTVAAMLTCLLVRSCAFYLGSYRQVLAHCSDDASLCCVVRSRESTTGYSSSYLVDVYEADGEKCRTRARLECAFASDYASGDDLRISEAEISDAASEYLSNLSDGVYLICSVSSKFSVEKLGNRGGTADSFFTAMKRRLSYILRTEIGGNGGKLCAAMLLGDRENLPGIVKLDFRRAGISHLLAVSGMHMSLCASLISGIMKKLRISRNVTLICVAAFLLFYLFLLGFPLSAVRSVIMLAVSYCGILFGLDGDGLSALSCALWLILMISPAAVTDTGFILSFCACFGILAFSPLYSGLGAKYRERMKKRPEYAGRKKTGRRIKDVCVLFCLESVLPPLMTVISANLMTIVPLALFFGEISLFSPVSNLFFPLVALPLMALSCLVLISSPWAELCAFFSYLASILSESMISIVSKISDIRGVTASLVQPYVLWLLIPMLCATAVLLAVRLKRKWIVLAPFAAAMCALLLLRAFPLSDNGFISIRGNGSNDVLTVSDGESAVVAEIGAGGYSFLNRSRERAAERGATELEAVILTHTHTAHLASVYRLFENMKTRILWLPEARTPDEAARILRLCEIAESFRVEPRIYSSFEELTLYGDVRFTCSGSVTVKRSTQPLTSIYVDYGCGSVLYLSASSWESPEICENVRIGPDTAVLCGRHGPVLKSTCTLPLFLAELIACREGTSYAYWFGSEENMPSRLGEFYIYTDEFIIPIKKTD